MIRPELLSPEKPLLGSASREDSLLELLRAYQEEPSSPRYLKLARALEPVFRGVLFRVRYAFEDEEEARAAIAAALVELMRRKDAREFEGNTRAKLRGDLLDLLRPHCRRVQRAIPTLPLGGQSSLVTEHENLGHSVLPLLEKAVEGGLIDETDRALLLGCVVGHNARQMGLTLGLSHCAARQRLHRAKKYLREGRKGKARAWFARRKSSLPK